MSLSRLWCAERGEIVALYDAKIYGKYKNKNGFYLKGTAVDTKRRENLNIKIKVAHNPREDKARVALRHKFLSLLRRHGTAAVSLVSGRDSFGRLLDRTVSLQGCYALPGAVI